MSTILVDTCVWYAIFDFRERPNDRENVAALADLIQSMNIVIPWPIMYETMCTRFNRNRLALEGFKRLLHSPQVTYLKDEKYRVAALQHSFDFSLGRGRSLSLTDCLLRIVLDDPDMRIKYFSTYNERDFSDVCYRRCIELLVN